MNLAIIGKRGHIGYVLDGLERLPDIQVVGLSAGAPGDDISDLTGWCAVHGQSPAVHDDYRDMLDAVRPDMVAVDGPYDLHAEMCIEAFQRGLHVFSEKPVATTYDQLADLRAAYAETDVHFASMVGLRYDPAFYTAWQCVREGGIGRVRLIDTRKSYKLGQRPEHYTKRETYGGTIPWVGSHAIDWMHWFSGKRFVSVCAAQSTACNAGHGDLEATAMCQFTIEEDIFATLSIDYLRPATAPTHGDDRIRVVGADGVIEVRNGEVFLVQEGAEGERKPEPRCDRQIFCDFVSQVTGKAESLVGAEETFVVTEACLKARESADIGKVVTFAS
jgi:predicted dehydrogenase